MVIMFFYNVLQIFEMSFGHFHLLLTKWASLTWSQSRHQDAGIGITRYHLAMLSGFFLFPSLSIQRETL